MAELPRNIVHRRNDEQHWVATDFECWIDWNPAQPVVEGEVTIEVPDGQSEVLAVSELEAGSGGTVNCVSFGTGNPNETGQTSLIVGGVGRTEWVLHGCRRVQLQLRTNDHDALLVVTTQST